MGFLPLGGVLPFGGVPLGFLPLGGALWLPFACGAPWSCLVLPQPTRREPESRTHAPIIALFLRIELFIIPSFHIGNYIFAGILRFRVVLSDDFSRIYAPFVYVIIDEFVRKS